MNEDKIKFQIESVPEEKETVGSATYSVEEIPSDRATAEADVTAEAEHGSAAETQAEAATQTAITEAPDSTQNVTAVSAMDENKETYAANFEKKNYMKEWLIAGLMVALIIVGIILAVLVERYQFAGIIIAVLAALAAYAMIKHVFVSEKVLKIVGDRDKVYLDEIMKALKRTKKPEFVREIAALIKEGHLVGYALMNDVFLEKREKK